MSTKKSPAITMLNMFVLAAAMQFLVVPFAYSGQDDGVIVDLVKAQQKFWIMPRKPFHPDQPYLLRFVMRPIEYSGSARLEISFDLPEDHYADDATYQFFGSVPGWPIRDHVHQSGSHFDIYLPALEAGKFAEFSIGWKGAPFEETRVSVLLTTDGGQTTHQYVGWRLQE